MATFYSILGFMSVNTFEYSEPGSFDILSSLPIEISIIILRMLPGKVLLNAACVNKSWFRICKSDRKLRLKIKQYIRQQRRTFISTRILASSGRNISSRLSNRPTMTNFVNTTNTRVSRMTLEQTTSRYMPYHREPTFGITKGAFKKNRSRNTGDITAARSRLRM